MAEIKPDPDPTVLTTDALNREVTNLKEIIETRFKAERELMDNKFDNVNDKFAIIEEHRLEQKQDTQREITKAFDANTSAIEAVEKVQNLANDRITAVEAARQGGVDMRVAILAFVSIVVGLIAIYGVFR